VLLTAVSIFALNILIDAHCSTPACANPLGFKGI
jgi:hypothetical protein